jgi:hypothetical protein
VGDPTSETAIVFEIDNEIAAGMDPRTVPTDAPHGSLKTPITDPFFIDLYWDGSTEGGLKAGDEGSEYPGDTSKEVTLVKAELDGEDVMVNAVRQDAGSWRLGIPGVDLGNHTLKYNAEDALGNSYDTDRELRFTVDPVPTWEMRLSAGMNLVSVPSEPGNGDINHLFGDAEQVQLIFTFEEGVSKVAIRNQDTGMFVGTLSRIDAQHAYWISAENAVTVDISVPPTSQLTPPPFISVTGGQWTLVPVISLGRVDDDTDGVGAAPGTKIDPDDYLGKFRAAFGWSGRNWTKIDPDAFDETGGLRHLTDDITDDETIDDEVERDAPLKVGQGYWVLYTEDSIITP